jgi:hypothetical protein
VVDEAFDAVLSVFSPRPIEEFRRIVRQDGILVIAAAGPRHLQELRDEFELLHVPEDKEEVLRTRLAPLFRCETERLTYKADLGADDARDLIAMGPNYRHGSHEGRAIAGVTVDFLLISGRPH